MYGPAAEKLVEAVRPILEKTSFVRGAEVKKRYGPPQAGTREVVIKNALQLRDAAADPASQLIAAVGLNPSPERSDPCYASCM